MFRATIRASAALLCLATAATVNLGLTGCGIGPADTSPTTGFNTPAHGFGGVVHGGPNPIVGATVVIWATNSSTPMAEADQVGSSAHQDTNASGQFNFSTTYSCPAGQFAFIESYGGNTGGNSTNTDAVLVAALGRCEDLFNYNSTSKTYTGWKGGSIYINELTTIAAAYALGSFSNDQGPTDPLPYNQVTIYGDAAANAAQVNGVSTGCVAGVGTCTTTATAGLAHAFINASLLVNVFTNTGLSSGANATVPGNANAIVPQALINTLGNILTACVNSSGGAKGSTGACGSLLSLTNLNLGASSGPGHVIDTWSAMVSLASNPTLAGSSSNVTALYNLITPQLNVYTPYYTSSTGINDYSIAIDYPGSSFGMTYPYTGATDINDNFYVGNTAGAGAGNGSGPANIVAFSYTQAATPTITVTAGPTNGSFSSAYGLSVDALGNGYFGNGAGSGTNALGSFATNGGAPGAITALPIGTSSTSTNLLKVYATAVDLQNHVWVYGAANGSPTNTLYQCPASFTASTQYCTARTGSTGAASSLGAALAIDPNQDVWSGSSNRLAVTGNTGSVSSPSYNDATGTSLSSPDPLLGIAFTDNGSILYAYASGYNAGTLTGVQSFTYRVEDSITGSVAGTDYFGASTGSETAMSGAYGDVADSSFQIWVASYNDHAVYQTYPYGGQYAYRIIPCAGSGATCTSIFAVNSTATNPTSVAVDSTGSLWVTAVNPSSPYGGQVVQVIGAAAPTWPLLSLGKVTSAP